MLSQGALKQHFSGSFIDNYKQYQKLTYLNANYLVDTYFDALNITNSTIVKFKLFQKKIPVISEWLRQTVKEKASSIIKSKSKKIVIDKIPYKNYFLTVNRCKVKQILDEEDFTTYLKLANNNWSLKQININPNTAKLIVKNIHNILVPSQSFCGHGALNSQQVFEIAEFIKKVVLDMNEDFGDEVLITKYLGDINIDYLEKTSFRIRLNLKNYKMLSHMAFKIRFDTNNRLSLEQAFF